MSWNEHIDRLSNGPSMKKVGLFGKEGNAWAASAGFNPTPQEIQMLVKLAEGKYTGNERITVAGQRYMYKEADDGMLSVLSLGGEEKFVCTVCLLETGAIVGVALAAAAGASRDYLDKYRKFLKGFGY